MNVMAGDPVIGPLRRLLGRRWSSLCVMVCAGAAVAIGGWGCVGEPASGPDRASGKHAGGGPGRVADRGTGADSESVFNRPLQRLSVEFKVHRYSAARGTFGPDSPLWRLVTGALPDSAAALRLADNGFRAAVGRESDRAPLREFLGGIADLQSALDHALPDASKQVELDLGRCRPREVVFYYRRGGMLTGLDFVDGRVKLMLTFELRSLSLREVWVRCVPVIEDPPGPLKWRITEEGARQVREERRTVFEDIAFEARIPDGGFLVLGPTPAVYERPLVARPFCVSFAGEDANGRAVLRESIYCISPIVRSYQQDRSEIGGGRR